MVEEQLERKIVQERKTVEEPLERMMAEGRKMAEGQQEHKTAGEHTMAEEHKTVVVEEHKRAGAGGSMPVEELAEGGPVAVRTPK